MAVERKLVDEHVRRVMVREYLKKETERAGFGGVDIQRTPMGTRITLIAERPGFVIGRRGATIKKLTEDLSTRFKLDNPQIDVQEDSNPSINASIMAMKLAEALERGWHFRRAGHSTLRRIMDGGAKGVLIVISGKITGGRSRREKFKEGHIKFCGEPSLIWMDVGYAVARKKLGAIGVKVAIMDPKARMPDEVEIKGAEHGGTPVASAPPPSIPPLSDYARSELASATQPQAIGTPTTTEGMEDEEGPTPPGHTGGSRKGGRPTKLTDIEGIGKKKAEALTAAGFGDVDALRQTSVDDLARIAGIGENLAKKIKQELERLDGGA
ncbi:MAG: 30S ribosomal protein S3 [Halobacteriales archaeon]|nr:30S ribosomal protein S3 [Halobacteriales archaeon]